MANTGTTGRWLGLSLLLTGIIAQPAGAVKLDVPRPEGQTSFVTDMAGLLDAQAQAHINDIGQKLLRDRAVPIIVVTIPSMAAVGGEDMRIETFARLLFDQWGVGYERVTINSKEASWNRGILLIVSVQDHKARIELGADWKRDKDDLAQQIMDEQIIYHFKRNEFDAGIVAGVEALDKMARGLELPSQPRPQWHYVLIAGFIALAIFTGVSLVRRGSGGWAWLFWGGVFAVVGFLLYTVLARGRSGGGGGFSGGSFGGGFSGGGGATGSW